MATAIIVGAGPGGLYTAYRLLKEKPEGITSVQIFEMSPERVGGRMWTKQFSNGAFADLGGMRFSTGHKVLGALRNLLAADIGGTIETTDFNETGDRLFHLRGQNRFQNDLASNPAPYKTPYADKLVDDVFGDLTVAVAGTGNRSRSEWCEFYENSVMTNSYHPIYDPTGQGNIYATGTPVKNIGYWNLMFDYLGSEGFKYAADAGGYSSNVINWNAADAIPYNAEFATDTKYERFKNGWSAFIDILRTQVEAMGGVITKDRQLRSFEATGSGVVCQFVDSAGAEKTAEGDYLFLAMPKRSVELVGQSADHNSSAWKLWTDPTIRLYLDSIIEQPSYKIGASFKTDWWTKCDHPPQLTYPQSEYKNWGPTITDLPLRQIYYLSGPDMKTVAGDPSYCMLVSYDDMRFTGFWNEMEPGLDELRTAAKSLDHQPLGTGGYCRIA